MEPTEVKQILEEAGVFVESHIVGTSGRHMGVYLNPDELYRRPPQLAWIASAMARCVEGAGDIDAVVGPAEGGNRLANALAAPLSAMLGRPVRALLTEKEEDGGFRFAMGHGFYAYRANLLVCEDALVTGGSARRIVELSRRLHARVLGVLGLWNRGVVTHTALGLGEGDMFRCLIDEMIPSWEEVDCPLCAAGVPVDPRYGHGKEFLARQRIEHSQ